MAINNRKSEFKHISCGVPQGSILGPLLFLLFINDLPLCTSNVCTDLYADDTTLYDVQNSMEQIESNIQIALDNLHVWCRENGMIINSLKTKVMLVTTNQKRQRLEKLDLKFNNDTLNTISNDKILGVFVDKNLNWTDHIKHLTKKLMQVFGSYQKLRNIYHRSIEFNSTSLTSNPILTFVALSGEVLLSPINARYSNYRNEHVRSSLTTG